MKNIATFMLVSALMLGFFTSCDSGVQHRTFRGIYADDPAGMDGLPKNILISLLIWKNSPNSMLPIAYHWFRPTSI